MDLGLQGKVVLVTGGARGIGLAIGGVLAAEGAVPVIAGHDQADNEAAVRAIAEKGATELVQILRHFDKTPSVADLWVAEKELKEIALADLGVDAAPKTKVVKLETPPKRSGGRKVGSVQELVQVLHNEAKVI